jgi:hypothetical protein
VAKKNTPVESRRHFILRDPAQQTVYYEVTKIFKGTDESDETTIIVSDVEHGRIILQRRASYREHTASYSISDVKMRDYIRVSTKTAYAATTRTETLEESMTSPDPRMDTMVPTVTTPGGEWRPIIGEAGEWQQMRSLRRAIRPTISFFLLEAIERMRGTLFSTAVGSIYDHMVGSYVVYRDGDDPKLELEEVTQPPACDFDQAFGFPCTAAQQKRIKKWADEGQPVEVY